MSKRIPVLEKMIASGTKDPFAFYALALEYAGAERGEDALKTFGDLRELDPNYVPMYLMCGQLLIRMDRRADAKEWLTKGVAVARMKTDMASQKALHELEDALGSLGA